jgi:hypothetical protein
MNAKAPSGKAARTASVYSTSEARANFAEALDAARKDGAVIGFDRYGHTVAALVPLEAIYILAGRGDRISPSTRERIERGAKNLVQDILQPEVQVIRALAKPKRAAGRAAPKPNVIPKRKRKRRSDS